MPTSHFRSERTDPSLAVNIIIETLRKTINDTPVNVEVIAQATRATSRTVVRVLREATGLEIVSGESLAVSNRFKIAQEAMKLGAVERTAKALTWQEFEDFCDDCFARAGFDTRKGVMFRDERRRWQVDLVAMKNGALLTADCKHWESPNYTSKFAKAVNHQKASLAPLIQHLRARGVLTSREVWALPMIITLYQPRKSIISDVILMSLGQLPDFLEHITPFDPELPFNSHLEPAESSMSHDFSKRDQ